MKLLDEYATTNDTFYVRLAAFQGLLLLEETEGVQEIIERLKRDEQDERLKELYSNF